MAHLITLDEHPETVALVLTLEEAAKIVWLTGHVTCGDPITSIYTFGLEHPGIELAYEEMECVNKCDGPITLEFRSIK